MQVSRSITQTPTPDLSSSMTLLILVSLWVTLEGSLPSASLSTTTEHSFSWARAKSISALQSAARPSLSSFRTFRNFWKRFGVWWKSTIDSKRGPPGRSASAHWNAPNARAAWYACSGEETASTVLAPSMKR